jgi:hypothetical protein
MAEVTPGSKAHPGPGHGASPAQSSQAVAKSYFRVDPDPASVARAIREYLLGAVESVAMIPALFYLRFRGVGPVGWGLTVFFIAYFLLAAVGVRDATGAGGSVADRDGAAAVAIRTGKSAPSGLPMLVLVTMLPVMTVTGTARDLWEWPSVKRLGDGTAAATPYLRHTDRWLDGGPQGEMLRG